MMVAPSGGVLILQALCRLFYGIHNPAGFDVRKKEGSLGVNSCSYCNLKGANKKSDLYTLQ